MSTERRLQLDAAFGQDEAIKRLMDLAAQFERGEIACAAVRVFAPDGTWEDVVIGGDTEEERAQALQALTQSDRLAN